MSLNDLYTRIDLASTVDTEKREDRKSFDWKNLNQSGQTVVRLVEGEGIPMILIHGASGNIVAFLPLQERFTTPLWAIQTTPETPLDSIEIMAHFYFLQIKAARPVGPYRIGGYSGCSLLTFHVARAFEGNGDSVVQFVMLDHFPMLYASPSFSIDGESIATRSRSKFVVEQALLPLLDIYRRDKQPARRAIANELMAAFNGLQVRDYIQSYYDVFVKIVAMVTKFLTELGGSIDDGPSHRQQQLRRWMREIKAPLTQIVAKDGMSRSLPSPNWEDLGCRACFEDARVLFTDAGHFDMFEMEAVVEELQYGW